MSIDAQTKVELKIPQLTLAKIAQLGRHVAVNTRSEHYGTLQYKTDYNLLLLCAMIVMTIYL